MALQVEWIDEARRWAELRPVWDGLVEAAESPSIFSTWDFLDACWAHFARPRQDGLAILALHEGGRTLGFAPLRLSRDRRLGLERRRLGHLAGWEADRVPFVLPRSREAECLDALLGFLSDRGGDWDLLDLAEVREEGPTLARLRAWASSQRDFLIREQPIAPSPYLSLEGTWHDVRSRFGFRLRRNLQNCLNRLAASGGHALEVWDDASRIGEAIDLYLALEGRSWKRHAGQGVGKSATQEAFYRDLLPRLCRAGRASVSFLKQGDERLSGLIEYRLGGTAYAVQMAYDGRKSRLSPGTVLMSLCLQRQHESGAREYELQAQFLDSKLRWTEAARANRDVRVLQLGGVRRRLLFFRSWAGSVFGGPARAPGPGAVAR